MKKHARYNRYNGFTLVELTAVIGIIGVAIPVLLSTVFIIIQQQTRALAIVQTQREGIRVVEHISNTIREKAIIIQKEDGGNLVTVCNHTSAVENRILTDTPLIFQDLTGISFSLQLQNTSLVLITGGIPTTLNTTKTDITHFDISCALKNETQDAIVTVSFVIQPHIRTTRETQAIALPFTRRILVQSSTL